MPNNDRDRRPAVADRGGADVKRTRIYINVEEEDGTGLDPTDWGLGEGVTAEEVIEFMRAESESVEQAMYDFSLLVNPSIIVSVVSTTDGRTQHSNATWSSA